MIGPSFPRLSRRLTPDRIRGKLRLGFQHAITIQFGDFMKSTPLSQPLSALLDAAAPHFSPAGQHYLKCRAGGVRFRGALESALQALASGALESALPPDLLLRATEAFGMILPPPAWVILSTGRKPVRSKSGLWQEEQRSLLEVPTLDADHLKTLDAKTQARLKEWHRVRILQSEIARQAFDHFHTDSSPPPLKTGKVRLRVVKSNAPPSPI